MGLLSLKVLLLAFFILLNALAEFETERSTAVLDSVREAFRGVVPAHESISEEIAALEVLDGAEDITEALGRLFDDSLPVVERETPGGSRSLQVDVPSEDLFAPSSIVINGEGLDLLMAIASVLDDARFAEQAYRLDVLYGVSGAGEELGSRLLAVRRAGAMVRALEREAVPADRLSAGLLPSFAGQVRLHFILPAPGDAAADPAAAPAVEGG